VATTEDNHAPQQGRAPEPNAPNSLIWVVRIGGMVALACAAAISAQTLFRLGRLLTFPPETAWLLPAALDVCAGVCIWTAAVLPAGHPGRRRATLYATLALGFTVISNVLYHAITLGEWTWQDDSLMGVSALPPFVVEILLHLQMIVTGGHGAKAAPAADTVHAEPWTLEDDARTEGHDDAHATESRIDPPVRIEEPATHTELGEAPQRIEPKPAPRNERTVRATGPKVTRLTPHTERARIIGALIAQHGVDGVTARIVGDALGVDRSNGYRALQRFLKENPTRAEKAPEAAPEDEPERAWTAS
jgi:hypothetical protein